MAESIELMEEYSTSNILVSGPRRSKRNNSTLNWLITPPSTVKKKKLNPRLKEETQMMCLTCLPKLVLDKLLQYLDVRSLENLSVTCLYFDHLIAGQYLLSINLPFPSDFLRDVNKAAIIEKKPLLKIECHKFENYQFKEVQMLVGVELGYCINILEYLLETQLSLLDLRKLREIDLVQSNLDVNTHDMDKIHSFDMELLQQIKSFGSFENVTRFQVLMDERSKFLKEHIEMMPSLIELGLHIHTRKSLGSGIVLNDYIPGLQSVVAASKAPILKLTILSETKKYLRKELSSTYVERLEVDAPCTVCIVPRMENLKEVVVKPRSKSGSVCTYWHSRVDDRDMHRVGLCCVNIGSMYKTCPMVIRFMEVDLESMMCKSMKFSKWNAKVKKKFYDVYRKSGGTMELQTWCKKRWFSKPPSVPSM